MRTQRLAVSVALVAMGGCTIESPLDPASISGDITDFFNQVAREIENAVKNPLDQKLYPKLLGGDSESIYYATNLGDIRVTFDGPSNDWVFPGIVGPSNLYVYQNGERRLARPLVPAGALSRMAFDGDSLAFVLSRNIGTPEFTESVIVSRAAFNNLTLLDAPLADGAFVTQLAISGERVAVLLDGASDAAADRVRLFDLRDPSAPDEFAAGRIGGLVLRGDRMAFLADDARIVLVELVAGSTVEVPAARALDLTLANNHVVWTVAGSSGSSAVYAYSIPDGVTKIWADAVPGRLAGATDDHFVTETTEIGSNGRTFRVVVRRYEVAGGSRVLADFRADGLAGQTMVLGNRAVFVNADRRIVVVPFDGGERFNFRPY